MNARELRRKYIDFFISKNGREFSSAPLVPIDVLGNEDPSLLFNSAGMVQFKPFFLGAANPPHNRLATAQKCLRTTDIESVGDTSHLTFFEMMGNFSFGDYFKEDAVVWAWEFLTECLELDPNRLRVTVYKDDDTAAELWHKKVGLPLERVSRFEEDHNYWPAKAISKGPNGPCGPCSEIFYDMFPDKPFDPDWDGEGDRWMEIWNLVFMQFERTGDFIVDNPSTNEGHWENVKLTPLPKKNIDTGMGLERTSTAISGFLSVYETDVLMPIINHIEKLSGQNYQTADLKIKEVIRIIADHIRSASFCIADGIRPDNSGRGYVLRRLIRRAVLKGLRQLGFDKPFFAEVFPAVIQALGDHYTELTERKAFIIKTLADEENQFRQTLKEGIRRAENMELTGRDAFNLYDTYGFPLEVTIELAQERGITVNIEEFNQAMEEQRLRSKTAGGIADELFSRSSVAMEELTKTVPITQFVGYDDECSASKILGIIKNGQIVTSANSGSAVEIVLDKSPLYAESGGQSGDTGKLTASNIVVNIKDTKKHNDRWIHIGIIESGEISVGLDVQAEVDKNRRTAIRRNHTATHLLHAALRQILGDHVHQAGSLVSPNYLRFDFAHNKGLTDDELNQVETIVNAKALEDIDVVTYADLPIAEAKAKGAMALFGEKYGNSVRMIEVGDYSKELCGGTHLKRTSQIGLFKIVSEGSVAGGIRRIEAITGEDAFKYVTERDKSIRDISRFLKTAPAEILGAVERLQSQIKQLEKQLEKAMVSQGSSDEVKTADVNGVSVVVCKTTVNAKAAGAIADRLATDNPNAVILVASSSDGKLVYVAKVMGDLTKKGVHAGNLVKALAELTGGGGGGRPDFAQAGGKDVDKLDSALSQVEDIIRKQLG